MDRICHVEAKDKPVFGVSPEPPEPPPEESGTLFTKDMETMLIKGSDSFKVFCSAE